MDHVGDFKANLISFPKSFTDNSVNIIPIKQIGNGKKVNIPDEVVNINTRHTEIEVIGSNVFKDNQSLQFIYAELVTTIGDSVFSGCTYLFIIYFLELT